MPTETERIILLLKKTFEKGAWHGPAVKEALEHISEEQAFKRLSGTHSIIELVAHMTAWRTYVIKRLEGDFTYKITEDLNFPDVRDWSEALRKLDESQELLLAAVAKLPPEKLNQQVPWTDDAFTFHAFVHGIIHHDLYHAGQIVLIKKATTEQTF